MQKVAASVAASWAQVPTDITLHKANLPSQHNDNLSVITENRIKTEQIDALNAELIRQKAMNEQLMAAPPSKKARISKAGDGVTLLLRETFKEKIWRSIKFISSENQMKHLTISTLRQANLSGKFTPDGQLTQQGQEFVENYCTTVNKILNDHRSYCQNAMKDVCIAWMKDHNRKTLSKNEEFMKIITRDPTVDKALFAWWWDVYMAKAAGTSKAWNKKIKYFGLLSKHAPPGNPNAVYITPSTEAWGMLLIINCRDRWPKIMELKKKSSSRITYVKTAKAATKAGTAYIDVSQDQSFVGVYTRADAGQKKFGGWSADGLRKYKELMDLNKAARAKATTQALEEEILAKLRQDNAITGDTWEEHKKAAVGDNTEVPVNEEVEGLFDMDEVGEMAAI